MASVSAIRRGQGLWCGSPETVIASGAPAGIAGPCARMYVLPFERALLHVRQLRRCQGNVADFLHQHRETRNGQRQRLLERHVAARHREPKRDLHVGLTGRKRAR